MESVGAFVADGMYTFVDATDIPKVQTPKDRTFVDREERLKGQIRTSVRKDIAMPRTGGIFNERWMSVRKDIAMPRTGILNETRPYRGAYIIPGIVRVKGPHCHSYAKGSLFLSTQPMSKLE